MISVPSFVNATTVAFPSLATIQETVSNQLDRMQAWSDEIFGGKYRDAAETLICGLILLTCCTAICLYDGSKQHLGQALGYWLVDAEQQLLFESGLWLSQLAFELLPVSQCFDECWTDLELSAVAAQQIFAYEVVIGAIAAETQ